LKQNQFSVKSEAGLSSRKHDYTHFLIYINIFLYNLIDFEGAKGIIGTCDRWHQKNRISMTLNWESTYAIALELRRQHPNINIEEVTLKQIYDWTLALSEFEDDPALVNDDILYAIYQDWFEENING